MDKIIDGIIWGHLGEEGITKEGIELVDLDIGYSPVIPFKGSPPLEVIELTGGKYRIPDCPFSPLNISSDDLKIMRYRYLINR